MLWLRKGALFAAFLCFATAFADYYLTVQRHGQPAAFLETAAGGEIVSRALLSGVLSSLQQAQQPLGSTSDLDRQQQSRLGAILDARNRIRLAGIRATGYSVLGAFLLAWAMMPVSRER